MKTPIADHLKEAWVLCFILGIIMLNYPFIHIFNKESMVFGVPALVLYFLIGWPVSIVVIFLFARSLGKGPGHDGTDSENDSRKGQR